MKTNLHGYYGTDRRLEEEGVDVPVGDNAAIRVRSMKSNHAQAVSRRVRKRYAHLTRKGELPQRILDEITMEVLCEGIVVGWRGITDENGEEVEFTLQNCRDLFEDLPHLRDDISAASMNLATFQDEENEEAVGN